MGKKTHPSHSSASEFEIEKSEPEEWLPPTKNRPHDSTSESEIEKSQSEDAATNKTVSRAQSDCENAGPSGSSSPRKRSLPLSEIEFHIVDPTTSTTTAKAPLAKKRCVDKNKTVNQKKSTHQKQRSTGNTRWKSWVKERFVSAFKDCADGILLDDNPPSLELCEKIYRKFPEDPGITASNIQTFIHNMCLKERRRQTMHDTCIDKWIQVIDAISPKENTIAKQLELIMNVAKQEPNDDAQSSTVDTSLPLPNYEAIYEYLSKAFAGKPLPELTPIDSLVVEDCMQSLMFQIERLNDGELRKSLRQLFLHLVQEPDKEPEYEQDELRRSLTNSSTVLNPLGMNAQAIVPVVPK